MLQIRTLNSNRNALQSETGTAPHKPPCGAGLRSSSRTRVTKLSDCRGYRFFSSLCAECPDAPAGQHIYLVAAFPVQILLSGSNPHGLLSLSSRGHTCDATKCSDRRVLLPLCGSAGWRRLREVVWFEAVCLACVGNEVRQAAHADTGEQLECGAAISATGARGTCATASVVLSFQP